MTKIRVTVFVLLLSTFVAARQSPTQTPTTSKCPGSADQGGPRKDVQSNIQSAIQKDPTLASANVTVDVKNGKSVELSGTVPSKDAKTSAERIASENAGGMKVKNHLKVVSAATPDKSDKSKPDTMS